MKVLFAVNNENISESITKKYQQEYKEIISVKNVYYFNAIIKELQRDKTYDRIVISEDLQPFSNNNYDAIDKFIFEKMDNISDEATNEDGNDIPIILISADRREKSDPLLIKLFGISVYNALIGKDRSITNVCELLYRPRTKKEAKIYYNIDPDDVDYKVENESDVSEVEIQSILNHYRRLGKDEDKYVESFNHIASQYTDSQLKLIIKFLPLNVKAVLEAKSTKYQELVSFNNATTKNSRQAQKYNDYEKNNKRNKNKVENSKNETSVDKINESLNKNSTMQNHVIIPTAINTNKVRKVSTISSVLPKIDEEKIVEPLDLTKDNELFEDEIENNEIEKTLNNTKLEEKIIEEPVAATRKRGRPKKIKIEEAEDNSVVKRGRGRPKKIIEEPETIDIEETLFNNQNKQKDNEFEDIDIQQENNQFEYNNMQEDHNEFEDINTQQNDDNEEDDNIFENNSTPLNLFELGEDEEESVKNNIANNDMILPGLDDEDNEVEEAQTSNYKNDNEFLEATTNFNNQNLADFLTRDKKIVAFVGTSKNGTSFLVNNIAELLSQKGINTAILDLTKNKNAYYIYTENEESLRETALNCIEDLENGKAKGIEVHKNLTAYTTLPTATQGNEDFSSILETLVKNYSLIILDCDFETNYNYFQNAQEIYLVQSLDILTIQPLTAFLRELKTKDILDPDKIRIVLNKVVNLRSINEKNIIGGMAYYNDPSMSFMTELFNKDNVKYCRIPFDEQAYSRYLDGIVNCKITLNGYSKNFMSVLNELSDMVYPLISNNSKANTFSNYNPNERFSAGMNNTLNKMKNNY